MAERDVGHPAAAPEVYTRRRNLTLVRKSDGQSDTVISESLRFFARPDQMAVIKALAARGANRSRGGAQDALEKLRENASSGDDSDRKKNDNARKRRLSRRAAAAVALGVSVGTVVLAGAWASQRGALGEAPIEVVSASASQVAQDLRTKVDSLVDSGWSRWGCLPVHRRPTARRRPPLPQHRPRK